MINEEYIVIKDDYANAGKVSSQIKQLLQTIGIKTNVLRKIAVACYEAEINMIIHAYGGKIYLELDDRGILTIRFSDTGPGIADIEKAMVPGYSTASDKARSMGFGAGMGLCNIKRVSDEFEINSTKEGTNLIIKFMVA